MWGRHGSNRRFPFIKSQLDTAMPLMNKTAPLGRKEQPVGKGQSEGAFNNSILHSNRK